MFFFPAMATADGCGTEPPQPLNKLPPPHFLAVAAQRSLSRGFHFTGECEPSLKSTAKFLTILAELFSILVFALH